MTEENNNKFKEGNEGEAEMRSLRIPELSFSKLIFLCILALLFASLEPFALFATIPFTLSFLLYGKAKTLLLALIGTALAVLMTQMQFYQGSAVGTFPMATIYAFLISQTIRSKTHPVKGIIRNGLSVFAIVIAILLTFNFAKEGGLRGVLEPYVQQISTAYYNGVKDLPEAPAEQLRQLEDLMKDPSTVVDSVMNYGISAIFIGIFLSVWVGTFATLKLGPLWRVFHHYPYGVKTLTSFTVPFAFVWPLIIALVLAVGQAYGYLGNWAEVVGYNLLLMLGIFYFFQGFGVLSFILNKWRIFGFFRTMVIVFTVITGYQVLALVGVLDTWVDFRRFFNKQNNDEGDKL